MTLDALPEPARLAVETIVGGPLAWTPAPVLEAAGVGDEVLADLVERELLEPWERPEGLAYTLSPYGSFVAEVLLIEPKDEADPHWGYPGDVPKAIRARRIAGEYPPPFEGFAELYPDPAPGPGEEVMHWGDDGLAVLLFGKTVPIDPKLGRKRPGKAKGKPGRKTPSRKSGRKAPGSPTALAGPEMAGVGAAIGPDSV